MKMQDKVGFKKFGDFYICFNLISLDIKGIPKKLFFIFFIFDILGYPDFSFNVPKNKYQEVA